MEKTHTHKVSRAAVAIAAGAALFPLAAQAQGDLTFDQIAKREILRRTQNVNKSDELRAEARKAYTEGDHKKSVSLYRQALSVIPGGRKMNQRRAFLNESLSQASVAYGKTLTRQGDRKQAIEVLEGVLRVDPNNTGADEALDDLYDPIRTELVRFVYVLCPAQDLTFCNLIEG
jgi:general secretion pathway protein D